MRLCVIIPTYKRDKAGITGPPLASALRCVAEQTYTDITVYVVGDYYSDQNEFDGVCDAYRDKISRLVTHNLGPHEHFRDVLKHDTDKLWHVGGAAAVNYGIKRAIADGMDWYFHLDDDDVWSPYHVQTYVDVIKKHPDVAFVCSKCHLTPKKVLPKQRITATRPGNYIPRGKDSVHATWMINLRAVGHVLVEHYDEETRWAFEAPHLITKPSDLRILDHIGSMKRLQCVCIPSFTVTYSGASKLVQ